MNISWETLEYEYKHKSADWYWAVGIIGVSLTIASFTLNNVLFAFFLFISTFTLMVYGARKPDMLHVEIIDKGIRMGGTLYPYASLSSFWVEDELHPPKIIIESEKYFMPYIVIPIGDVDPERIRRVLLTKMKEEEHAEPVVQQLMDYLGF